MKILNRLFLFLSVLWAVVIFMFSSQNGTQSSELSGKITIFIADFFIKGFGNLSLRAMKGILDAIQLFVRKFAHFSEYAIFAGFIYTTVMTGVLCRGDKRITGIWQEWKIKAGGITQALVTVYAISDEIHQGLVSGRNPSLLDILIDSTGGFTAILIATAILSHIVRKKMKMEEQS